MPGAWFYDLIYRYGVSFSGASRVTAGIEPGEMERLFGQAWDIEHLTEFDDDTQEAVFLVTRHDSTA